MSHSSWSRFLTASAHWWQAGRTFCLPRHCVWCFGSLPLSSESCERKICVECERVLSQPDHAFACRRCGAPLRESHPAAADCPKCERESFSFERVLRLGVYENDLARAVLRGKQPHSEALLAVLAQLFWQRNLVDLQAAGIEVVVPIPQHWSQRWQRSHNPAQVLAENWAERLHVPFDQYLLRKTRRTPKQHTLSPAERRLSPRKAYVVASRHDLSGRTVLLADDVLTTGTTAQVATRLLLDAGARRVLVGVIACGIGQTATV